MDPFFEKWEFLRSKLNEYKHRFRFLKGELARLEEENVLLQKELDRLRNENESLRAGLTKDVLKEEWVGNFVSPQEARMSLDEMIKKLNRIIESLKHET